MQYRFGYNLRTMLVDTLQFLEMKAATLTTSMLVLWREIQGRCTLELAILDSCVEPKMYKLMEVCETYITVVVLIIRTPIELMFDIL